MLKDILKLLNESISWLQDIILRCFSLKFTHCLKNSIMFLRIVLFSCHLKIYYFPGIKVSMGYIFWENKAINYFLKSVEYFLDMHCSEQILVYLLKRQRKYLVEAESRKKLFLRRTNNAKSK